MVLVWTPLINSLSGGGLLAWRDTSPPSPPRYSSANRSACVGHNVQTHRAFKWALLGRCGICRGIRMDFLSIPNHIINTSCI